MQPSHQKTPETCCAGCHREEKLWPFQPCQRRGHTIPGRAYSTSPGTWRFEHPWETLLCFKWHHQLERVNLQVKRRLEAFVSPSLTGGGWAAHEHPGRTTRFSCIHSTQGRSELSPASLWGSWSLFSHLLPQPTCSSCSTPSRTQGSLISSETLAQALIKEGALILGTEDPLIM